MRYRCSSSTITGTSFPNANTFAITQSRLVAALQSLSVAATSFALRAWLDVDLALDFMQVAMFTTSTKCGATYRGEHYADPGFYYGYYAYYDQCTVYVWVTYVSYDDGETWEETGEVEYAGCW